MLKRHEVEILLKASHSKAEVARLAVCPCALLSALRRSSGGPCG